MKKDIGIHVRFSGRQSFPSALISDVLDIIDDAIFQTQKRDLEYAKNNIELPELSLDAALHRIDNYHGVNFLLKGSNRGSLIITGIVAGLAFWVLKNTLGETLKEAWKDTDMHRRLKDLLLWRMKGKSKEVKEEIERNFRNFRYVNKSRTDFDIKVRLYNDKHDNYDIDDIDINENCREIIIIEVYSHDIGNTPPSYGEIIDEDVKPKNY